MWHSLTWNFSPKHETINRIKTRMSVTMLPCRQPADVHTIKTAWKGMSTPCTKPHKPIRVTWTRHSSGLLGAVSSCNINVRYAAQYPAALASEVKQYKQRNSIAKYSTWRINLGICPLCTFPQPGRNSNKYVAREKNPWSWRLPSHRQASRL